MDFDIDLAAARFGMLTSGIVFFICVLIARSTDLIFFWVLTFLSGGVLCFFSWFNRCPVCGHSLGRHHWFIQYCPYCGNCL